MKIPTIDQVIKKLVRTHESRDPYHLAQSLGILVITEDLGVEIFGYYNRINRIKMIHINSRCVEQMQRLTAAHELGHAILHPNENTPMLSKKTIVSELKLEKEANYFAVNLLIDSQKTQLEYKNIGLSKFDLLKMNGINEEFERYLS